MTAPVSYCIRGFANAARAVAASIESWEEGHQRDALLDLMTSFPALPILTAVRVLRGSVNWEAGRLTLTIHH